MFVMKPNLLFWLCIPLLFTGCFREKYGCTHYCFGNKTDKVVRVVSYYDLDANGEPRGIEYSFDVIQGGEYEITRSAMGHFPRPFDTRYVRISDGEREVTFVRYSDRLDQKTYLYEKESYQVVKSKRYEIWYRYDFTEADFRYGVPVTEKAGTELLT